MQTPLTVDQVSAVNAGSRHAICVCPACERPVSLVDVKACLSSLSADIYLFGGVLHEILTGVLVDALAACMQLS